MQVIAVIAVIVVVALILADYEPINKRIDKMDNDPNNSVKSNKWHREHDNN